jgi:SAM-dependent methyltransferase
VFGSAVLESLLACPVCHAAPLVGVGEGLTCTGCGRSFESERGVPDLTPHPLPDGDINARRPLWEEVERNGLVGYEADPEHNLSVTDREVTRAFGHFARLEGLVLDVGCGPQPQPSYARDFEGTLVGIDPLRGANRREFEFVQGLGEYLPFRAGVFDRVLFATTLDHMLLPQRALREAARVTASGGEIAVWCGDESTKPAFTGTSAGWYQSLRVPQGAEDRFHVARVDRDTVLDLLVDAGLAVIEEAADGAGSLFVRARLSAS